MRRALKRPALTVAVLERRVSGESGAFILSWAWPSFPQTDAGQFTINLKVPTGTRIEVTDQYVAKVEDLIRQIGRIRRISR